MGNGYSGESVRHPTPVERDVAAPVDRVLSKEQTTSADERDDKATDRYTMTDSVEIPTAILGFTTMTSSKSAPK